MYRDLDLNGPLYLNGPVGGNLGLRFSMLVVPYPPNMVGSMVKIVVQTDGSEDKYSHGIEESESGD